MGKKMSNKLKIRNKTHIWYLRILDRKLRGKNYDGTALYVFICELDAGF